MPLLMPRAIEIKSVLNRKKFYDSWFLDEYTLNPYSGCSFNCLYCYTQGSKYGHNMEDKVSVKSNALEVLDKQLSLRARKKEFGFIVLASATDPYLHFEKDLLLTRGMLELIQKYRFPVHMLTRSDLIIRDFDLLEKINRDSILPDYFQGRLQDKVIISFSFGTVNQHIADIFEPGAPLLEKRITAIEAAIQARFKTGVSLMPLIPFISDTTEELEKTFLLFSNLNINHLMPSTITLFGNERGDSKWLMFRAIEKHYPHLLEKYKRWFENADYMPEYYQKAFVKKMKELSLKYGVKDKII